MNKKISIFIFLTLFFIFSINAIYANDLNISDITSSSSESNIENKIHENDLNTFSANHSGAIFEESFKNQTEFTEASTSIYYTAPCCITLKDSNTNESLSNKSINFVINEVNYTVTTDDEGIASVNLKLKPGKYTADAYFSGDDSYESCNLTTKFNVLPTIKAKNISKYYKGDTPYSATFFDSQGNALSNAEVVITVNGKSYTRKTNGKGVASMPINLKPGTYKVVSTDLITGYNLTTTFKILSTISSKSIKKIAGDNRKFKAKFFKSNGKALSNQVIKFKLDGKTYKVKTNSKGQASLALKKLNKGTYKIICYNKDGYSKVYKIKVYNIASTKLITNYYKLLPKDSKVIKVKLVTSLDDYLISGKVINIKINEKTFYKKTNNRGIVSLKLPSLKNGLYAVKYRYDGAKYFKASKAKNFVAILSTANTALKVKSTKTFGYGAGTLFKLSCTAGNVPIAKKSVTIKIGSKTYKKSTDIKGIVSIPINLKIGKYVIDYGTKGDSKLNGSSGSSIIKVIKRSESKLTWKSGSSYKDYSQSFKVLLTDLKGKAISGQKIKLTIDSETYAATTSSRGYAKFKTDAAIGKYKVSVKFGGSNYYLKSSTSKSINVKLTKLIGGVNEKNTVRYLSQYLKSSYHCQVGNSRIKSIVNSLTRGLTSDLDKAKSIFNYVRDNVEYSGYYNTKYGAVGTLAVKKGNCVDLAHLLVAMYRTANLKSRYVHGTCHFESGYIGHVWAQVLVGNTWICADASNDINSFGKIKNWNTNSYSFHSRYSSLPF